MGEGECGEIFVRIWLINYGLLSKLVEEKELEERFSSEYSEYK